MFPFMVAVSPGLTTTLVSFLTSAAGGVAGAAVSFVSVLAESELLLQPAMIMPANKIPKNIRVSFVLSCLIILVVLRHKFTILS